MIDWSYESTEKVSTGYEDVLDDLKKYNRTNFLEMTEEKQSSVVNDIFNIYREKGIFPIRYYNEEGCIDEIKKCINKEVSFDGEVLNLPLNQGSSLCRFLFPNMTQVVCKGAENNTPYKKFYEGDSLKKAINFCLRHKKTNYPVTPSGVKDGLEMMGGNVATNFKPMNAKALFEFYTPNGGIVFDFSAGFGGRMLGCLSSKNNYRYIGVEPCTDTYKHLGELYKNIKKATGRSNIAKARCQGSEEELDFKDSSVDFAFSSPPYFNLEKYSDEETQCYNKYPTLGEWFEGYVRGTIKNIYRLLKSDCHYAVNIADFNIGKERVEYVDRWIEISEEEGFTFDKTIYMKLQKRRGIGHGENKRDKKEGIFVFKKEK